LAISDLTNSFRLFIAENLCLGLGLRQWQSDLACQAIPHRIDLVPRISVINCYNAPSWCYQAIQMGWVA